MDENKREVSDLTVIALVASILIAPVGWFLGFRARKEIERTNSFGRPFATAAIWIGGIITISLLAMLGLGFAGAALGDGQINWGMGCRNHMMLGGDNDMKDENSHDGTDEMMEGDN